MSYDLLIRPITAVVTLGDQRGRLLGFPTANLHPVDADAIGRGVYAAWALTQDGTEWPAAVNVGTRPTFKGADERTSVEVHLIGFEGDIYRETLTVRLVRRLRDERRFTSIDALVAQLERDVVAAGTLLRERGTCSRLVA